MSHTDEARRAGDAAGLGGSSLFCRCDNPDNKPSNHQIQPTNEPRLKYLAARLHDLGPKPLFHFLDEVERGADLPSHLERYGALPGAFVRALGDDHFPPNVYIVRDECP
jgi:hypothetical protein